MHMIRTDLAMEAREMAKEQQRPDIPGVKTEEVRLEGMQVTRVRIHSPEGEARLGKPQGNYITLEIAPMADRDPAYEEAVSHQLAEEIRALTSLKQDSTVLVVGLGNWNVTPDAVGPKVVDKLMVTRHILESVPEQVDERLRPLCAVAPGVLGITGIETGEIVKGISDRVKPDLIIAIDALASRKTERIGTTIQLADTGIHPGSGVGNKRMALSRETLGVQTLALGIPTVVYAHTIGRDAIEVFMSRLAADEKSGEEIQRVFLKMDEHQVDDVVYKVLDEQLGEMVVTPKEVDKLIDSVASIIADGINLAVHQDISLEEINRFLH